MVTSTFPDTLNPQVAIDVLQGDLGTDSGRGQSIFCINQSMVDAGRLKRMQRTNLGLGQDVRLPDGTDVRFDGAQWWVNLQVAHDPFEMWVLVCAIAIIGGLSASLSIKRRRIWVRVVPAGGDPSGDETASARSVIEVGGLARTDQAGYGEEFVGLAADLIGQNAEDVTTPDDSPDPEKPDSGDPDSGDDEVNSEPQSPSDSSMRGKNS